MLYIKSFFFLISIIYCYGNFGIDLSIKLDQSDWLQLEVQYATTITSASLHILFYNQTLNSNAPRSLISASNFGIKDLSVYMHPCIPGSNYDQQSNSKQCTGATSQFESIYNFLTNNKISFKSHSVTGFNINSLHSANYSFQSLAVVNRIFINLEDESPNRYFHSNKTINHKFISEFINTAYKYAIEVGIYTTKGDWNNIMPQNVLLRNPYSKLVPLWIPRFDGIATLDFFRSFNGWNSSSILMKQISGGSTELRRVGSSRICTNYVVSTVASAITINLQVIY